MFSNKYLLLLAVFFINSSSILAFQNTQYVTAITSPTSSTVCQGGSACSISFTYDNTAVNDPTTPLYGFKLEYQSTSGGAIYLIDSEVEANPLSSTYNYIGWIPNSSVDDYYKVIITDLIGNAQDYDLSSNPKESSGFLITANPYIDITSPSSGTYTNGDIVTVTYTTNDTNIDFYLRDENLNDTPITLDGNNQFTIGSSVAEANYWLYAQGDNASDFSSQFTIEPKNLTINYPYDGLIFQRGTAEPVIQWTANYVPPNGVEIWAEDEDNVFDITDLAGPVTAFPDGATRYIWQIPSDFHLDNDFEIYIRDNVNTSVMDVQSGTFTVTDEQQGESYTLNSAQSTTIKTPISSATQIDALPVDDKAEAVSYVDGTGRVRQSIALESTPNQQDVITHFEYNEIGQKTIDYLPFVTSPTQGEMVDDPLDKQEDFYCLDSNCTQSSSTGVTANSHPYSRVIVEASPLQTTKEQGAIGADWQPEGGNTIRYETHANVTGDDIIHWVVNSSGHPEGNGFYDPSLIIKSKTTDEDENVSYVYTNREGQEILKVGYLNGEGSQAVKTYYVYDHFGNLRFIIPPEAVDEIENTANYETLTLGDTHTIRTMWLTEMQYDGYHRVVYKKIPEAEPVYTVYDKLGRVALTQDGNMRQSNEWFFTKYDIKGRAIMTGTYSEEDQTRQSREDMQAYLNDWTGDTWEERTSSNFDTQHGYTFQTFPNSLVHSVIWSVTWYDDYDFNNDGTADETFSPHADFASLTGNNRSAHEADVIRTQGMVTGSKTRILTPRQVFENDSGEYGEGHPSAADEVYYIGTSNTNYSITLKPGFKTYPGQTVQIGSSDISVPSSVMDNHTQGEWLEGVTFYDKYGRTIYTKSTNHLGGHDWNWTLYHFDGEVEQTIYTHTNTDPVNTTIKNRFEYDHAGRLIAQYQNTNNQGEIQIVENEYNELGQLITKKLNNVLVNNVMTPTQTVDYTYHVRGWLQSVNNPSNLGTDLFAYRLYYNTIPALGQSLNKYNGNIISQDWATNLPTGEERHRYDYSYDGLNQLTFARKNRFIPGCQNNCDEWTNYYEGWGTSYTYDLNGNIQTLNRAGETYYNDDQLSYSYTGNQIQAITDNANSTYKDNGFVDGASTTQEYVYDLNGNMTSDANKGITSITYNQMNLPEIITFSNGNEMVYVYDAAGSKLRKTTYPAGGGTGVVTDYANGVVYTDGVLDFTHFAEGRIRKNGSTWGYEYDLKDHLGNVRATFTSGSYNSAVLLQADHYYPFGYKMPGLSYLTGTENKFTYNGKELEDEFGLNWYHYGARYYDPVIGRWWVVDPMDEFNSPYTYVGNNSISFVDPDGMFSTHTDEEGNVVAVIDDGDTGIYAHSGTLEDILDKTSNCMTTSCGGIKMGETHYWDEFLSVSHNGTRGSIIDGAKVHFGESWEGIISRLHSVASRDIGFSVGVMSSPNGYYDIKNNPEHSPSGIGTGRLLDGKYVTARSAGNYLAGMNSMGRGRDYIQVMKLAGALHQGGVTGVAEHVLLGTEFGNGFPWYGEHDYAGRMILRGMIKSNGASDLRPAILLGLYNQGIIE